MSDVVVGEDGRPRCPWGAVDAGLRGLPRPGVGQADPRRRRPVRAADARGVPVRSLVADDPAQAGELPGGLRWFRHRPGSRRSTQPTASDCWPTPGSSATARRSTPRSHNAKAAAHLDEGLAEVIWAFAQPNRPAPVRLDDVPAQTAESKALAKELKRRGFVFVGPTTAYALMQAAGLVNDHLRDCWVRTAHE